jgi:undecaprenyl-diphosphatase
MNVALFRFLNGTIQNPFLDRVLPLVSSKDFVVVPGIVAVLLLLYFGTGRTRVCLVALGLALVCSNFGSEKLLKNFFEEKRPYATLEGVHLHRTRVWVTSNPEWFVQDTRQSNSFPSSHAANVAAVAVVLAFVRRRTLWGTIPLAALVGLSRVYTGNHYPGDVVAGYVWGAACGYFLASGALWLARSIWRGAIGGGASNADGAGTEDAAVRAGGVCGSGDAVDVGRAGVDDD